MGEIDSIRLAVICLAVKIRKLIEKVLRCERNAYLCDMNGEEEQKRKKLLYADRKKFANTHIHFVRKSFWPENKNFSNLMDFSFFMNEDGFLIKTRHRYDDSSVQR